MSKNVFYILNYSFAAYCSLACVTHADLGGSVLAMVRWSGVCQVQPGFEANCRLEDTAFKMS